ncbi:MAG: histidine phosphatase family protein [Candidatus Heimdallarchaeota archaeon]|nr:histidine phosphatase family protein [Candidatus Heimdallarchaeota archaeon]
MNLDNIQLDLFLIRHAQPLNSPNHWTAPSSPLSDQGIIQAKQLAQDLEKTNFDKLISSPFLRTTETAEYILQNLMSKTSVAFQEWIAEINLGVWAGKRKSEIMSDPNYPEFLPKDKAVFQEPLVGKLLNTHKNFTFPGGESLESFWNRVQLGFLNLINDYRNLDKKTIGLVGHGGSFSVITSILLGKTFTDNIFPIIAIKMAKYAYIRIYKDRVIFVKLN